ncbi:MAG: NUDIX domain-containing protein, partial [Oscillospiraceae bacterium]
ATLKFGHYFNLTEVGTVDITYKSDEGRFNFRVAGLIIFNNKLLVMKDERSPYYYLPGGRVALHETTELAIKRELLEELEIHADIKRLVWTVESFFSEDVSKEKFHELAFYYEIDVTKTDLLGRGNQFILNEGGRHRLEFTWLSFDEVETAYIYPLFLKEKIMNLPTATQHIVEYE